MIIRLLYLTMLGLGLIAVDADESADPVGGGAQGRGDRLGFRLGGQEAEGDRPETLAEDEEDV